MEEELVLHSFHSPRSVDPEVVIARTWATLGQLANYREEASSFPSCGLGRLPLVRYGRFFFAHGHILNFFRLAFDFDFDLTPEERKESELMAELCVSRLHPATVYGMWMDHSTPKEFFKGRQSALWTLLTYPFEGLRFRWERMEIRSYLERQHRVVSHFDAFRMADDVHSKLSARLGDRTFFHSAERRLNYPRSLDIVVYAYLLEELGNLQTHPHVNDSLFKYPNLRAFVVRMESLIRSMSKWQPDAPYYDFFYVHPPAVEPTIDHPPRLSINPQLYDPGFFEPERLKTEDPPLPVKSAAPSSTVVRDGYIAGSGLILLLFLYFRN